MKIDLKSWPINEWSIISFYYLNFSCFIENILIFKTNYFQSEINYYFVQQLKFVLKVVIIDKSILQRTKNHFVITKTSARNLLHQVDKHFSCIFA